MAVVPDTANLPSTGFISASCAGTENISAFHAAANASSEPSPPSASVNSAISAFGATLCRPEANASAAAVEEIEPLYESNAITIFINNRIFLEREYNFNA